MYIGSEDFARALAFELILCPHTIHHTMYMHGMHYRGVCMCVQVCMPVCLCCVLSHHCHWPSPTEIGSILTTTRIVLHNEIHTSTCLYMQ